MTENKDAIKAGMEAAAEVRADQDSKDEEFKAKSEARVLHYITAEIGKVLWELEEALREVRIATRQNQPITTSMRDRLHVAHLKAEAAIAKFQPSNGGYRV